jgi:hypothetical protein
MVSRKTRKLPGTILRRKLRIRDRSDRRAAMIIAANPFRGFTACRADSATIIVASPVQAPPSAPAWRAMIIAGSPVLQPVVLVSLTRPIACPLLDAVRGPSDERAI